MNHATVIGIICAISGAIIGVLTYKINYSNNLKKDATSQSVIATKLDYIGKGVDDIRLDIKSQDRKINELNERVIKVEASAKSGHKRIDKLEEVSKSERNS